MRTPVDAARKLTGLTLPLAVVASSSGVQMLLGETGKNKILGDIGARRSEIAGPENA